HLWKDAYGGLLGSVGYSLYGASGRRSIPAFLCRRVRHSERADTRYARVNRSQQNTPRRGDFAFKLALGLMIAVIGYQNVMYKLNMDDDIASLAKPIGAEWMIPSS